MCVLMFQILFTTASGANCVATNFPRVMGGTNDETGYTTLDSDSIGNIVLGGYSKDNGVTGSGSQRPIAVYIAKGGGVIWGYSYKVNSRNLNYVMSMKFNPGGNKIVMAFDYGGDEWLLMVLNAIDGSVCNQFHSLTFLVAMYLDNNQNKAYPTADCLLYDSSDLIYFVFMRNNPIDFVLLAIGASAAQSSSYFQATLYMDMYSNCYNNNIGGHAAAHSIHEDSSGSYLFVSGAMCKNTSYVYTVYTTIGVFNKATGALIKVNAKTQGTSVTRYIQRMDISENGAQTDIFFCNSDTATQLHFTLLGFSLTSLTFNYESNMQLSFCNGQQFYYRNFGYYTTVLQLKSLGSYQGYILHQKSNKDVELGMINFFTGVYTYQTITEYSQASSSFFYAKWVDTSIFYFVGSVKKILGTLNQNWSKNVGVLQSFDPSYGTCIAYSYTLSSSNTFTTFTSTYNQMATSNFIFRTSRYIVVENNTLTVSALNTGLVSNAFCPLNTYVFTLVSPTIPDIYYAINSGTQTFTHTPFTMAESCDDVSVYHSYSQVSWPNSNPTITYNSTTQTFTFSSTSNSDVGNTYQVMVTGKLSNGQSASVTFKIYVERECYFASVTSYEISDVSHDISQGQQGIYTYIASYDWTSNMTSNTCKTSALTWVLNDTSTNWYASSGIYYQNYTPSPYQIYAYSTNSYYVGAHSLKLQAYLQGYLVAEQPFTITITNNCPNTIVSINGGVGDQTYLVNQAVQYISVPTWTETYGYCGSIYINTYKYNSTWISTNTASQPFAWISTNNSLQVYTTSTALIGTYLISIGGYTQYGSVTGSLTFYVTIYPDMCATATVTVSTIKDSVLYIGQSGQSLSFTPFTLYSSTGTKIVCGTWVYTFTDGSGNALDSVFTTTQSPKITLSTSDLTKKDLSPQTVKVTGTQPAYPSFTSTVTFKIYLVYNDTTDCPQGQYYNTSTAACQTCVTPCSSCLSYSQCSWCVSGYNYVEDSSYSCQLTSISCPAGTVLDTYLPICRQCPTQCSICSSSTVCTTCLDDYNLASDGKCYKKAQCPSGTKYDSTTNSCETCPSNCLSCSSSSVCTYCASGYYLTSSNTCSATCSSGYYANSTSRTCMICQPDCQTCTTNNYTCTSCYSGTYLYNNNCVYRCPYEGYYQNSLANTCDDCYTGCLYCIASTTDCPVCKSGYVRNSRTCTSACSTSQYIDVNSQCRNCDSACYACYDGYSTTCTVCNTGYYLYGNECMTSCPYGYFENAATLTCDACPYYCDDCSSTSVCNVCNAGYKRSGTTCIGEYFLKTSSSFYLTSPIKSSLQNTAYNPTAMTIEIWFKMDNITATSNIEIILGTSPYKIRRRPQSTQIELNYNAAINYCTTGSLDVLTWYHFAFTIDESYATLYCYLNGVSYNTGSGTGIISTNVTAPLEITFGSTLYPKTLETNFNGYIKEFRWWNESRSTFNISSFKNLYHSTLPSTLFSYWRLDEPNDGTKTYFTDSADISLTSTPTTALTTVVEMREIYLKLCSDGYYVNYDYINGYYTCLACNGFCKNCLNSTSSNCTECSSPYVIVESLYQCVLVGSCPTGYFKNSTDGLCQSCNYPCKSCYGASNFCQACKPGYFREFILGVGTGSGCVEECPTGMYGNYESQSCKYLPQVKIVEPNDGDLFTFGDLIDAQAAYTLLNSESNSTFTYGWIVTRTNGLLDVSDDIVKNYANYNGLKIHFDNNVIESNNNYNVTFYVKGDSTYYKGLLVSAFVEMYVGTPPKNGKCNVNPMSGYATKDTFTITQSGWIDEIGIANYNYYYSFDSGETFLPINDQGYTDTTIKYTSKSIYDNYNVIVKCEAVNSKGFSNYAVNSIVLNKRSNADATADLNSMVISNTVTSTEKDCLQTAQQLYLLAQNLGDLQQNDNDIFDPKLSSKDDCTKSLCNNAGTCYYQTYTKKYYCNCTGTYGGQNCTFKNKTQMTALQTLNLQLHNAYGMLGNYQYQYEFLKLTTAFKEILNDDIVGSCITILKTVILYWDSELQSQETIQNYLVIASNLLEYIEYDQLQNNVTNNWYQSVSSKNWTNYGTKVATVQTNLNNLLSITSLLRNNSLYSINELDTQFAYTSRMLAIKQAYTSQSSFNKFSATSKSKSPQTTYLKVTSANFLNQSNKLEQNFVLEASEYALNPYQLNNTQYLATNAFEANIYNYTTFQKVSIANLSTSFEFFYPASDNYNLTDFVSTYTNLNPFKTTDIATRSTLLKNSLLDCNYWNGSYWNNSGCQLYTIDTTHIRCLCNHLSSFGIQFITPITTSTAVTTSNVIKATTPTQSDITVDDLQKWPLSEYINNLHELMQHKPPSALSFFMKPGVYLILLFWIMYITSLIYYNGKDKLKRYHMTKGQNRTDLAEMKDDDIQQLDTVIRDLLARDLTALTHNNQETVAAATNREAAELRPMIFGEMNKEEKKKFKKKARKKVFGRVGTLSERARRFYQKVFKRQSDSNEAKMKFFNEELKNNFWIGLMGKTSKIAPRHARLTVMYFYIALHLICVTIAYSFTLQDQIFGEDNSMFNTLALACVSLWGIWIITVPVALLMRMPMSIRRQVEGLKTKKINKAFVELDKQMGIRYAIGYFICYTTYTLMTLVVIFFNFFYPQEYTFEWFKNLFILYILDLIIFTFAIAGLQLLNALLSQKVKCWYNVWAAIEIFRYVKNLRG